MGIVYRWLCLLLQLCTLLVGLLSLLDVSLVHYELHAGFRPGGRPLPAALRVGREFASLDGDVATPAAELTHGRVALLPVVVMATTTAISIDQVIATFPLFLKEE